MDIGGLCTPDPVTIDRDATVPELARVLRDEHVGVVVVMDGSAVLGLVSDRDIAVSVVAEVPDTARSLSAGDLVRGDAMVFRSDMSAWNAVQAMVEVGARRVPVVDEDDALVGVLSATDLLQFVAEQLSMLAELSNARVEAEVLRQA